MTQEDKELLLKDICGRLPYGVKVILGDKPMYAWTLESVSIEKNDVIDVYIESGNFPLEAVKPYLRPMSSMTEEEIDTMWNIWEHNSASEAASKITDFLNGRFLDHHQLIKKGLAIEAPEGMPYKWLNNK